MCLKIQYKPDYAIPVGYVLEEHMKTHSMTVSQLSNLVSIEPEIIQACLEGRCVLNSTIAKKLEKAFGLCADIWMKIESDHLVYKNANSHE